MSGSIYESELGRRLAGFVLAAAAAVCGCGRSAPNVRPAMVASDAVVGSAATTSVAITATISPTHASPGDAVVLELQFRIAPGWHIEPIEHLSDPPQPALPVEIGFQLPTGISPMAAWIIPETQLQLGPNGQTQGYAGNVAFKRRLLIDQHASPGPLELRCAVGCQLCNATLCTRPAQVELKATVDVDEE